MPGAAGLPAIRKPSAGIAMADPASSFPGALRSN
jgi:hypothetical protein